MRPRDERYLLRVWRDDAGNGAARASLRHLGTSEQHHFADLERLLDFLHRGAPHAQAGRAPAVRGARRAADRGEGTGRADSAGAGSESAGAGTEDDAGSGTGWEP